MLKRPAENLQRRPLGPVSATSRFLGFLKLQPHVEHLILDLDIQISTAMLLKGLYQQEHS